MSKNAEDTILNKSISLSEGSPARISASLDSVRELTASDPASGASSIESFASYDRATSSWRTSQHSLTEAWAEFSETWPQAGTMRSGECFRLTNLGSTIAANESLLLPTQTAREGRDWSRVEVLASLDRGDGVAKRICRLRIGELDRCLIVGLNPSYAEKRMGFPIGFTDLKHSETPLSLTLQKESEEES